MLPFLLHLPAHIVKIFPCRHPPLQPRGNGGLLSAVCFLSLHLRLYVPNYFRERAIAEADHDYPDQ